MPRFLDGIRILDLTRLLPGPLCTWHLHRLGAEIIKIEGPGEGDYAKTMGDLDVDGISFFYKHLNVGKAVHVLDLKQPADHARFLAMVNKADAVMESFRPGVMTRLQLDHAQLAAVNPRVCLISISGYGQHSLHAHVAGHDINYMAASGMLYELLGMVQDARNFIPMPNLQLGDVLGGAVSAAMMALAAILNAQRTGQGTHVDVSMTAQLQANNVMPLFETMAHGRPSNSGEGLLNGGVPCYGLYRTADHRFLAVGALELKFWQALCDALQRPELRSIHWQLGEPLASQPHLQARQTLEAIFITRTQQQWTQSLKGVDCCISPVLRFDEIAPHP
jgi:alpha-methylacyl-CoA racemase